MARLISQITGAITRNVQDGRRPRPKESVRTSTKVIAAQTRPISSTALSAAASSAMASRQRRAASNASGRPSAPAAPSVVARVKNRPNWPKATWPRCRLTSGSTASPMS